MTRRGCTFGACLAAANIVVAGACSDPSTDAAANGSDSGGDVDATVEPAPDAADASPRDAADEEAIAPPPACGDRVCTSTEACCGGCPELGRGAACASSTRVCYSEYLECQAEKERRRDAGP